MPTENHDFRQPPRGQENWDQDWYHNFDTLDERVVARGVEADRGEYTPYQNALYLATDTENIFRGTGDGWVQLESFGVNPDFGQATADKVVLNNEPTDPTDAVRLQDVDTSGHDHTGDTLNPDTVNTQSASVSNAPASETDVARQAEINSLDSAKAEQSEVDSLSSTVDTKADQDGGGTASLDNYASVNTDSASVTNDLSSGSVDTDILSINSWEWVDVTDAGADPTGTEDSAPAINSAVGEGRLLVFPQGTYFLGDMIDATGHDFIGLYAPGRATIKITDTFSSSTVFNMGSSSNPTHSSFVEGFEFDYTDPETGARAINAGIEGYGLFRDIDVVGQHDAGEPGPFRFDAYLESAAIDAVGLRATDGGEYAVNTPGDIKPTGCLVGANHYGTVRLIDVHLTQWADNGVYASNAHGPVIVEGGQFKNNNTSQIRLGSKGSRAHSARIVVDTTRSEDTGIKGLWMRNESGMMAEGLSIEYTGGDPGSLGAPIEITGACEGAVVNNCDVTLDVSTRGLGVSALDSGMVDRGVEINNLTISGSATGNSSQWTARIDRPGVVLRNLRIYQNPGSSTPRWGIRIGEGTSRIEGGIIHTDERAIELNSNENVVEAVEDLTAGAHALNDQGSDNRLSNIDPSNVSSFTTGGTRLRWNGIIGGGPVGGEDIGSLTGASAGDYARADGTTATANTLWCFNGTDWVRVDGGNTITPA